MLRAFLEDKYAIHTNKAAHTEVMKYMGGNMRREFEYTRHPIGRHLWPVS